MAEEKKNVPVNAEEINDEELDLVAGGKYTQAEWNSMSKAEREAAQRTSAILISQGKAAECKYVN